MSNHSAQVSEFGIRPLQIKIKEGKDNMTADSQISTESQRLEWTRRLAKRMNGKGISNRGLEISDFCADRSHIESSHQLK